jgi:3-phosphoshikimate 1-carboxyvinyltransferase
MILIIDNYDSFTYNLVQYIGSINSDILVKHNDELTINEIHRLSPDCIVISPGPGKPENAGLSIEIIKVFYKTIPILGICLGHQAIVKAFGGNVIKAPEIIHGKTSQINHLNSLIFTDIPLSFSATRYHSLIADRSTFPSELKETAQTSNNLIMAFEHKSYPTYGVQFHPESISTEYGFQMIDNFIRLVSQQKEIKSKDAMKKSITFAGDKSISHRALILASIANGVSEIENLSQGEDVKSTIRCLQECGIHIDTNEDIIKVYGGTLQNPDKPLNCGNSGTTARLLLGLLVGEGIEATLIGDYSLSTRPMDRVIKPLTLMGANIQSENGKLPITIKKSQLNGIDYNMTVASAQVKSAILLASLGANSKTTIIEKYLTRDHTERLLEYIGVEIDYSEHYIELNQYHKSISYFSIAIPSDPSTASFFVAATLLSTNYNLTIRNLLANTTRSGFNSAIKTMGANIECLGKNIKFNEPVGDLKIKSSKLIGIHLTSKDIPHIIDELPILAILATQANGKTEIRGAKELRYKETDRIHAICKNLKKMGGDIIEHEDGFTINGPTQLNGAIIETFDDHRIAMAFSIAGLISDGDIILDNEECINISSPEFSEKLLYFSKL